MKILAWLERKAPDGKPDAATVDLVADARKQRGKKQDEADDHEGVFVVGSLIHILHEYNDRYHEDDT